jgi:hypothetical protein
MVPVAGLEPAPSSISGWRLYQLGYTGVYGERMVLLLLASRIAGNKPILRQLSDKAIMAMDMTAVA